MSRRLRIALLAVLALGAVGTTAVVAQSRAVRQAAATITPEQAREAALRAFPGATAEPADESVELETEDGKSVYEVEITLNGREMDVLVDAETGAVLSSEVEDDEAGESDDDEAGEMEDDDETGDMEDDEDGEEDEDDGMAAARVPGAVSTALRSAHPAATDVEWTREDDGYEASFAESGSDVSVVFSASGAVQETETEIAVADLPAAVRRTLDRDYAGRTVSEAARIVAADGAVTYEAELTQGGRTVDVVFDASGAVVSTEED